MPLTYSLRAPQEEVGRRVHSEGYSHGEGAAAARGSSAVGVRGPAVSGSWIKRQPVSAAERMQMAQDLAAQQRELRLRLRALKVPGEEEEVRTRGGAAAGEATWKVELQPLHPEKSVVAARAPSQQPDRELKRSGAKASGGGGGGGDAGEASADKSNDAVLSAKVSECVVVVGSSSDSGSLSDSRSDSMAAAAAAVVVVVVYTKLFCRPR